MARTPAEPRIARLHELEPGQTADVFALLAKKDRGQTRDSKPFYRVTFRDAHRSVTTMIWLDGGWFEDCEQHWRVGEYYKLRGRYQENQYGPQFDLEKWRLIEPGDTAQGFDPADFHTATRFDTAALFDELVGLAKQHITQPDLKTLTVSLLRDHQELLVLMAAAAHNHHAYQGGYLEHVVSVTKTAIYLADKYVEHYPAMQPPLSKSLVVAGAILHDIGKLLELQHRPEGAEYTPSGRLIGHILLGRDLVRDSARRIEDFDAETLLRLEHIIVSHQALPEWGSPIAPSTPEALLVHYADDIDAKFQMMALALTTPPTADEQVFTTRDNPLKRRIFRGLPTDESNSGAQ